MRYLITGGAGFIGSHLADELLGRGHARSRARRPLDRVDGEHPAPQGATPGSTTRSSPARRTRVVAELVDEADVVYHLAAAVGVELIVESPVRTIETNLRCTEVVLEQAEQEAPAGVRRLDQRGVRQVAAPSRSRRTATWSWAPPTWRAGPTRAPRRSTSSSRSPTGRSASSRPSSAASSTPSGRARPAVRHGRPELRPPGAGRPARSPSSATARSSAASATWAMSCARSPTSRSATTSTARSSTSAPTRRSRSGSWPIGSVR